MIKFVAVLIVCMVLVSGLAICAHEAGHWLIGKAFGYEGELRLVHGNVIASIWYDQPLSDEADIPITLAGGLGGMIAGFIVLAIAKLIKHQMLRPAIVLSAVMTIILHYVYGLDETFGMKTQFQILFAVVAFFMFSQIFIIELKGGALCSLSLKSSSG